VALAIGSTDANAATVIGQSPPLAGGPAGCGNANNSVVQLSVASGPAYVIPPGGGVITSWRTGPLSGDRHVALRVFTGDPAGTEFTPVAQSETEIFPSEAAPSFPTRIPVAGGELLGLLIPTDDLVTGCIYVGAADGNVWGLTTAKPVGETETHSRTPGGLLNLSAALEPDADHDGFGDETQDRCPTDATTQAECPAAAGPTGQRAAALKKCKKKHSRKKRRKCRKKARKLPVSLTTAGR
jgi:hypothetical protein